MKMAKLCIVTHQKHIWVFDNLIADEITEKREVPETERVRDRENLLINVINLDFTYQMALVDLGNDTTAW